MTPEEHSQLIILLNSLEWHPEQWDALVREARAISADPSIEYMFFVAALEIAAIRGCLVEKCQEIRQDIVCQEYQEVV